MPQFSFMYPIVSGLSPQAVAATGNQCITCFGNNFGFNSCSSTLRLGGSSGLSSLWRSSSSLVSKIASIAESNSINQLVVSLPSLYFSLNSSASMSVIVLHTLPVLPAFESQCHAVSDTLSVQVKWRVSLSTTISLTFHVFCYLLERCQTGTTPMVTSTCAISMRLPCVHKGYWSFTWKAIDGTCCR